LLAWRALDNVVDVVDPADPEAVPHPEPLAVHDMVFVSASSNQSANGRLYLAERAGHTAFAFDLFLDGGRLELAALPDELPMRRWPGKGLVRAIGLAWYDFADRWVPLQPFPECTFAGQAVLVSPVWLPDSDGSIHPPVNELVQPPGGPFDGRDPGCIWHRLMLDAEIPAGTAVVVRARASDDPHLLAVADWVPQPGPYLRSGGAELPYYDPWADLRSPAIPFAESTGTWELLFQGLRGRYLQLELTLAGTGRSTPLLRAVRAWYPRFSYLEHYLPGIYREDPTDASFLDRWLANFEGLYTNIEDRLDGVSALFDPRTAPPEALDWLACWLGIALDPLWDEAQRRFFIRHAAELYRRRGTPAGIEAALRLYLEPAPGEDLLDLRCVGRGEVRLVERFQTRGAGPYAYGDPDPEGRRPLRPLTRADVADSAHRFVVLTPHNLSDDDQRMLARIAELEKPAHTEVELRRYWDLFLVGEARIELDTRLGESARFEPFQLGHTELAAGILAAPYPFDIAERIVPQRDRLGGLPGL
jgi:phage tail-like protein